MPGPPFDNHLALKLGNFVHEAYNVFFDIAPPAELPPNYNSPQFQVPSGYNLVQIVYANDLFSPIVDYKIFGLIAQSMDGSDVVVTLRGTQGVFEWIRNVIFDHTPFDYVAGAGQAEQGFMEFYRTLGDAPNPGAQRVVDVLRPLVTAGGVSTLRITGHSLGAALTTLLALDVAANIDLAGSNVSLAVYTFASPAVGDKVFAGTYDTRVQNSWRIANQMDIVTYLPPPFAGYAHVDAAYPINSDDQTAFSVSCWHSLETYMHVLDGGVTPLDPGCAT